MSKLKNNIDSISNDTENIAKDYLNLLIIRITERLSLFIGIFFSVFIISTLLLIIFLGLHHLHTPAYCSAYWFNCPRRFPE